jgi:L-alanine-DL-glutamate epimerase-like enolase superfamily enzyme
VDIIDVANALHGATTKWRPVVVHIKTDEGISGFGEVGLAYGVGASAGFGMAKDLAKIIIGMDPMKNEAIWDKMQKKTFWGQGGGTVVSAGMSGIDIALWDIKGKAMNMPIYQLLGGKTRDKIRAYASQVQFGWGPGKDKAMLVEPAVFAEAARCAVAEGYSALKVNAIAMDGEGNWNSQQLCGPLSVKTLRLAYNRIKAIRDAVGPDIDIIVEMNAFTDTTAAIQFGRMIEELGIYYYEEPVMPLNPQQMKKVADSLNIPIATGERIYTRWGFRPFFESGCLDVVQPDIGNCGGLTETKKVCDMAHFTPVQINFSRLRDAE